MTYGTIRILRLDNPSVLNIIGSWKKAQVMPYSKYDIKESDFRVKTATFTTNHYIDLTTGQYAILIYSKYHENFSGVILDVDYDEDKGEYTYQCQDWSRRYIGKFEAIVNNVKLYKLLRHLITLSYVSASKPTKKQLKEYKPILSGLRGIGQYQQSLYKGNLTKKNWFNQSISAIFRDKSYIEVIRSLVYSTLGYYDVWFNDNGVLQIEPISKVDWENTGLILTNGEHYNRKYKFSTANAITEVNVNGSDLKLGKLIQSTNATNLDLSAFFGTVGTSISNPNQNKTKAVTTTKNKNKSTTTKKNKYNNPFNNKKRKVWLNADGGSNAMKNAFAKVLRKNGWTVHVGRTFSNAHYEDYWNVTKDYSVCATMYNGFCAGTIREAYSSNIQNVLKSKGVQLVVLFDTQGWTNPHGMKPYKYGNFKGYTVHRAGDDNFSVGDPTIRNVADWLKKKKAVYCANPSASGMYKQFEAGGYFKYKGIKV